MTVTRQLFSMSAYRHAVIFLSAVISDNAYRLKYNSNVMLQLYLLDASVARRFQTRPEPGLAFISSLIAMLTKEPEMLQPDAFCEHTMQQNATAAGAPDPTGEAYSAPQIF